MKKFLLFAISLCLSFQAEAEEIANAEVQKSLEQTQATMQKSFEEMDRQMQQMMPVMAQSMSQMMQDVFKTLPPLMKSLEENRVFSKAAEQMNQEINTQVKQLNDELKEYKNYKQQKNASAQDKFAVSGSKNENGKTLDFSFVQNDEALNNLRAAIAAKTDSQTRQESAQPLADLKGHRFELNEFKLENIGDNSYLVRENNDETFIAGIINGGIIVRVQTSGENASARARNFIANSGQKVLYKK